MISRRLAAGIGAYRGAREAAKAPHAAAKQTAGAVRAEGKLTIGRGRSNWEGARAR
jgi:hypothetical protein